MSERRLYVTRPPPTAQRALDLWLQQLADEINSLPSFLGTDSDGQAVLGVEADTVLPGDEGQVLRSGASETAWSTATFPDDATAGDLLHASAASTWSALAIGSEHDVLTVDGSSQPAWKTGLTEENLDGALNARDIMYTFALMGA